ncbi:MAG: hypothetical protein HC788_00410 [Sphingopyxis sp.]|nr:hypothetical protein [Sphingopyxis sp.]
MAGPLTIVAAIITMACAPLLLPKGAAGVDHLILPILLLPAFWAAFFLYALLERNPVRGVIVMIAIILAAAAMVYRQF